MVIGEFLRPNLTHAGMGVKMKCAEKENYIHKNILKSKTHKSDIFTDPVRACVRACVLPFPYIGLLPLSLMLMPKTNSI
jgi:hypothetical protein